MDHPDGKDEADVEKAGRGMERALFNCAPVLSHRSGKRRERPHAGLGEEA